MFFVIITFAIANLNCQVRLEMLFGFVCSQLNFEIVIEHFVHLSQAEFSATELPVGMMVWLDLSLQVYLLYYFSEVQLALISFEDLVMLFVKEATWLLQLAFQLPPIWD